MSAGNRSHGSFVFRGFPALDGRRWVLAPPLAATSALALLANALLLYVIVSVQHLHSPICIEIPHNLSTFRVEAGDLSLCARERAHGEPLGSGERPSRFPRRRSVDSERAVGECRDNKGGGRNTLFSSSGRTVNNRGGSLILGAAMRTAAPGDERRKAFRTCGTHLMVMTVFYLVGSVTFLSHNLGLAIPTDANSAMGLLYILTPAAANPVIYGARTAEIRNGFRRLLGLGDAGKAKVSPADAAVQIRRRQNDPAVASDRR